MGSFAKLPNELILAVAKVLPRARDLSAFARSSRRLNEVLTQLLYDIALSDGGWGALRWAASKGSVPALMNLLNRYNVSPMLRDEDTMMTALHVAAYHKQAEVASLLLDRGVDPEATSTHYDRESPSGVHFDRDPNEDEMYFCATPLHLAAESGSTEVLLLLLQRQVNVRATLETALLGDLAAPLQQQAIHNASAMGFTNFVEMLLAAGVDVNARDSRDGTPLHYAVYGNDNFDTTPVVTLLLNRGADVSLTDNLGHTPFGKAASQGRHELIDLMLGLRPSLTKDMDALSEALYLTVKRYVGMRRVPGGSKESYTSKCVKILLAVGTDMDATINIARDRNDRLTERVISFLEGLQMLV